MSSIKYLLNLFPSKLMVEIYLMSDFRKLCIIFYIFKQQKYDVFQNGVEFCQITIGEDIMWLPFYFSYCCPFTGPMEVWICQPTNYDMGQFGQGSNYLIGHFVV